MNNQDEMLRKKSFQGKVESAVWRKGATLRDILDAMDQIKAADIDTKQKAALLQRVIDYGQHLSEQIHLGKRQVSETDDNETIKEFNLRMQHSAYSKHHHDKFHGEPTHGEGYYDKRDNFVEVPYSNTSVSTDQTVRGGATNPRWHPIPLKEDPIKPFPVDPHVIPVDPHDNTGVITPPPPTPTPTPTPTPIPTPVTPNVNDTPNTPENSQKKTEKKRKKLPFMLIPIIAAGILAKECKPSPVIVKDYEPEKEEQVVSASISSNPNESAYLTYTTEKGKAMLKKQGIENPDILYDNFVNNMDKMPQEIKDMIEKYNMGTARDTDADINITNNPQVAATTLILLAESYPNVAPTIHALIQNPETKISPVQLSALNTRCKMAESAQKKHTGNLDGINHISTIDYGLAGANKKTGPSVKFDNNNNKEDYNFVVKSVFNDGKSHNY